MEAGARRGATTQNLNIPEGVDHGQVALAPLDRRARNSAADGSRPPPSGELCEGGSPA